MKRVLFIVFATCLSMQMMAQPARRRTQTQEDGKTEKSTIALSERAKIQYNVTSAMPEEVVWKRDVYRTLDLEKEQNAVLYYPIEPIGEQMNLFTLLFKLLLTDEVPAYEYRLDGTEQLTSENKVKVQDVLDRFHVLYEEKDGKFIVDNSDIPASEVLSYYIKESSYYDQRTATYQTRVTAICPVLHRDDGFSEQATKYPMFWVNYDEVSSYLERMAVMTSSYNNASNMSINDFFVTHRYKGDIYKTTNLRNLTLAQYCPTDSALTEEQERIEAQLQAFERNIWVAPVKEEPVDTTSVAGKDEKKEKKSSHTVRRNAAENEDKKVEKKKTSPTTSTAPVVSVRRQRR
ncbi:MAG: gliding motility protein GldN [Bacteroidaceae bacterium]|nr:gliding motility protein GldN [Bacteroidaceae bacterium]